METSTPSTKNSKDLRRRTLLRVAETPIPTEGVNDESERSSRRSFIEMQKKIQSPNKAQSPALNDSVRFSGEQEIKDHFQICTKLYAENKITARVAWQLHIIDLLRVVSKKQRPDTLQVASTSLDIGAKVYSLRVDDIHAAGLKLANSMARFGQKDSANDGDKDDNADNEDNPEAGPAQRKKRKLKYTDGPKNTISKDPKNLLAPVPKLESVFFSTRINSDMSTVENLFTNRLPMDKSCYKFMVLSDEKAWVTGPDEAVEGLEEETVFDDNFPKGGNICIPFQDFILDKWDIDEEERKNAERSISQPSKDVLVYDDEGLPMPELDGSIHDIFNGNHDDNMADDDEPREEDFVVQQMQHEIANVVDLMRFEDDVRRSEYSYNSVISTSNGKVIDQIWAGPSHWKLKFLRRSRARFSGAIEALSAQKPKKKVKTVEPMPIDLLDFETDYEKVLDNLKRIRLKKRVNLTNKVTLPMPDSSCVSLLKNVYELMIKPGTVPVSKKDVSSVQETKDLESDAQHNMENDIADNSHMDHDGFHGDDFINEEEEIAVSNEQQFMGDNLVDAPEYVPKAYIPYALQAKKMDMKKLKGHIWQMLANCPLESTNGI
ncbi:hypothetical protein WA026_011521 [Henosepilachna vigintioctopunctata]|uniref:Condensin complex subunit 2 n=1 Tax=Henosepilachna vigintioctopunctata TaxID=420089 RepID=A0AAW1TT32_9CUCU